MGCSCLMQSHDDAKAKVKPSTASTAAATTCSLGGLRQGARVIEDSRSRLIFHGAKWGIFMSTRPKAARGSARPRPTALPKASTPLYKLAHSSPWPETTAMVLCRSPLAGPAGTRRKVEASQLAKIKRKRKRYGSAPCKSSSVGRENRANNLVKPSVHGSHSSCNRLSLTSAPSTSTPVQGGMVRLSEHMRNRTWA